ncbi:MAG: phosphopentomutase, partial [Treponema sp.]
MLDVGRVIARPFIGESGAYQRTPNRHDYSLEPPGTTILDRLAAAGKPVIGVGKISDIFAARGISQSYPIKNNRDGMERTIALAEQEGSGLVFTNLVDFDMKYGHRRDVTGYRDALEEFDSMLPDLLGKLREDELLIITADHGCDPVFRGTDHTREYIPILAAGPAIQPCALGVRSTFADIASTVAEALLGTTDEGSFAGQILQGGA